MGQILTCSPTNSSSEEETITELRNQLSSLREEVRNNRNWVINRSEVQMPVIGRSLGEGAWGRVVRGTFCCCDVAVKEMHNDIVSPHNIRLFEREINMASRCRHPCLLQFIGATADNAKPLLVTELMDRNLRSLYEEAELREEQVAVIFLDVARALNYLHQNTPEPIIHRDISSANVLLWKKESNGEQKFLIMIDVFSFGILLCEVCIRELPNPNRRVRQVDIFSFGVLLCQMCIGELPDPERQGQHELLG
ncbi:serine/threonine-protein kinase STY17-like [Stylophora pistillata]|uniref:serine/threonine-protein kinase STY17-like n=1 Tax=Stylophora pistillata TaxID=50429 RepID=UPI000C04D18E|nr:serine/threonine-protein kinase STY17-like [Stylophora pistillata]